MIPFAPERIAEVIAAWISAADPSVTIVLEVHPSSPAPAAMIDPCSVQVSVPQLMNTIFLPAGIGFVIGAVIPIDVGRLECAATRARASDRAVLRAGDSLAELAALVLLVFVLLLPILLQPTAASRTASSSRSGVAARGLRRAGSRCDMGSLQVS